MRPRWIFKVTTLGGEGRRCRSHFTAALVAGVVGASVLSPTTPAIASTMAGTPALSDTTTKDVGHGHDVIANLWEWNWPSIASECTNVLGPQGYGGVQVAPPQDSLKRTEPFETPILHPWYEVYQPVDYKLTSRMGSPAEFKSMVQTCRSAGVRVYADVVINHMTGQGNVSYGGVSYSKYEYPGIYDTSDFHHAPADCPTASGTIEDFNSYLQVVGRELVGLSDLATQQRDVRKRLGRYLNKLLRFGVSGFRVDAAKHVGHVDLAAIESRLDRTVDGTRPYVALEVFPGGPGTLSPWAYRPEGDLLGFDAAYQIKSAFKSYTADGTGDITTAADVRQGVRPLTDRQDSRFRPEPRHGA